MESHDANLDYNVKTVEMESNLEIKWYLFGQLKKINK